MGPLPWVCWTFSFRGLTCVSMIPYCAPAVRALPSHFVGPCRSPIRTSSTCLQPGGRGLSVLDSSRVASPQPRQSVTINQAARLLLWSGKFRDNGGHRRRELREPLKSLGPNNAMTEDASYAKRAKNEHPGFPCRFRPSINGRPLGMFEPPLVRNLHTWTKSTASTPEVGVRLQ